MSYQNLKAEMARRGIQIQDLANLLNVHRNSVYNKFKKGGLSVEDAIRIRDAFFPSLDMEYLFGKCTA